MGDQHTLAEADGRVTEAVARQAQEQRFEAAVQALNRRHATIVADIGTRYRQEQERARAEAEALQAAAEKRVRALEEAAAGLRASLDGMQTSLRDAEAARDRLHGRLERLRARWYGPFILRTFLDD